MKKLESKIAGGVEESSSRSVRTGRNTGRSALRTHRLLAAASLAVAAVGVIAPGVARADDYWALGNQTGDFNPGSNWNLGVNPTSGVQNAVNGGTGTDGAHQGGTILFSASDPSSTIFDLRAGDGANYTGTWLQTGSLLTANSWFRLATSPSATGTFNITGGTFVGHGNIRVGEQGTGILYVGGNGTFTADGSLNGAHWAIGDAATASGLMVVAGNGTANDTATNDGAPLQVTSTAGATGLLVLQDNGQINTNSNELWIGQNGTGTMNMSGGTLNVGNWLVVGRGTGTGVLNLTGGVVNETGALSHFTMTGTGIVNHTGGTINANNNAMWVGEGTTATYNLSGTGVVNAGAGLIIENSAAGTGIFNLNAGGTLNTQYISHNATTGTSIFNFNGGQLIATGSGPNGLFLSNLSSAAVLAGGANINLNGNSTTFATPLTTGTAANVSDGGLHITGNGGETLTMLGNNTFSGQAVFGNNVNLTLGNGSAAGSLLGAGGLNYGGGTLTVASQAGGGNAIAGPLSGSGPINVNYGLLELGSSNNTYTGALTVNQGAGIILGTGGTTGALSVGSVLNFQNGAIFGYNHSDSLTFAGLTGVSNFTLEQTGTGILNIGASNNATALIVASGVMNVTDPAALNTVTSIYAAYPAALAVPASLENQTTLNLFNTASGGILALTAGTSNNLDFSLTPNLRLGAFVPGANGSASATSTVTYNGTVNPAPAYASATSTTVTGHTLVLGGGGSTLIYASAIADGGTVNSVTDTTPTAIDINGGRVSLSNAGNTFTGTVTVQPDGTLVLPTAVAGTFGDASSLVLRGGVVLYPANDATPADITTLTRATASTAGTVGSTIPAYIANGYSARINTNGNNVTFNGPLGGAPANSASPALTSIGSFSKQGLGTLTDNSQIVSTTLFVNAGTLLLSGNTSSATLNNYASIGQAIGDNGTLTLDNGATMSGVGDFNVADVAGPATGPADLGTFNILNTAFASNASSPVTTLKANTVFIGKGNSAANNNASGVVNQGPGTLVAVNGNFQVGVFGQGIYNMSGGTLTSGFLSIGRYTPGVGIFNMTGGSVTSSAGVIVGESGTGTLNVSGTSTITTPYLYVALGSDNTSTSGTVNQNGGTITAANGVRFAPSAPAGSTSTFTGVYNLNGGILNTPGFTTSISAPNITSTLNFNGTQIVASNSSGAFLAGTTNAVVMGGGANFNTAGFTVTINKTLTSGTAVGTPDGGLTKSGTGTLILSSTQGYTGTTNITGGTLRLVGSTVPVQAGLVAWYDASDTSSLVTNGSNVTAFLNKGQGGNGLNAVASSTAAEATVTPLGAPNGTTTNVTLNGTAAYNTSANDPISGNQNRTLFVVGSRATNAGAYLANQGVLATNTAYGLSIETGNTYGYTYNNDVTFGVQAANQSVIVDTTLNSSGTKLSGDLIQATVSPMVTAYNATVAANTTASVLQIAGRTGGNSSGTLDEVLEYNVALTPDQTAAVEQYLESKYFSGYGANAVTSNLLPTTTTLNLSTGGVLDLNGTNQTVAGLTGTGGSVLVGAGTFTVNNTVTNTYGGIITATPAGTFNVTGGSKLSIGSTTATAIQVQSLGNLTIGSGAMLALTPAATHAGRQLVVANSLNITGTGSLDLGNGDLDLNSSSNSLSSVTALVAKGYNLTGGANWQGTGGITSASAAADSKHLTALGTIQNNQNGNQLYGAGTQFDGTNPGASDILVKYTYFGDANLDGKIDGSDYSLIDAGYGSHGSSTGWLNGDFNYDGVVDGSDYALIDNAFNNQGSVLTTPSALTANIAAQVAGPTAVPEPASIALIGVAVGGLLARRRRA